MNRESQAAKAMTSPPSSAKPFPYIIVEIADDPHTRRSLEAACFDRKFLYNNVKAKDPMIHPAPGNTFYRIYYNDAVQLFWLGVFFQSQQTKP